MKTRWDVAAILILAGFLLGIGAGRLYHGLGGEPQNTPPSPTQSEEDPCSLVAKRDNELRQAIEALVKKEGSTATVLNHREAVFSRMVNDLAKVHGSAIYNIKIFRYFERYLREYGGPRAKARVLEIGPGINLGTGLLFSMGGVQKYYGLDIYKDPDLFAAPQYESIVDLMTVIAPGDILTPPENILTVAGGEVTFNPSRVEYLYPLQSYDIPLPAHSLDFIFSNATMEHVTDPMRTIQSFARVLRHAGVTVHSIDLRYHSDFSKPLEFLKLDPATWKERFKDPRVAHRYQNRWRASDFKAAFENNGFQILKMEPTHRHEVTDEMRRSLHPDFQHYSLDDLSITGILVVAKRR